MEFIHKFICLGRSLRLWSTLVVYLLSILLLYLLKSISCHVFERIVILLCHLIFWLLIREQQTEHLVVWIYISEHFHNGGLVNLLCLGWSLSLQCSIASANPDCPVTYRSYMVSASSICTARADTAVWLSVFPEWAVWNKKLCHMWKACLHAHLPGQLMHI